MLIVGKRVYVFGCICKYFQIHTKYQLLIHTLLLFPSQIQIHNISVVKYKYVFEPNPGKHIVCVHGWLVSRVEITGHNFPESLKRHFLSQAEEIARKCVQPPLKKKPK